MALLLAQPWALAAPVQPQQPTPRMQAPPPCVGDIDTAAPLSVAQGKSLMLDLQHRGLPSPAWLRAVGDTDVLQLEPTASAAPRAMFFLFGKKVGATNLLFQNRDGRCGWIEVAIGIDTGAVEARLRQLLPHEAGIRVGAAADSLV
ncbi:MAG TPA: pilus assembly protein N-terminal domain-containing protein, partial [Noviherbaspirillum sp.]